MTTAAYQCDTSTPLPKVLYLDSRFAQYPTSREYYNGESVAMFGPRSSMQSDCEFYLEQALVAPPNCALLLSLLHGCVSDTYYNEVLGVNDQLSVARGTASGAGAETVLVQVPPGRYTPADIAAPIQQHMNAALQISAVAGVTDDVKVTYLAVQRRLLLTFGENQTTDIGLRFLSLGAEGVSSRPLMTELGLRSDEPSSAALPAGAVWSAAESRWSVVVTQPSSAVSQLLGGLLFPEAVTLEQDLSTLQLRCSLTKNGSSWASAEGGGVTPGRISVSTVLAAVPVSDAGTAPGGSIPLVPATPTPVLLQALALTSIRVALTTSRNQLVELNGGYFQCALQLQWVYSGRLQRPPDESEERRSKLLKVHMQHLVLKRKTEDKKAQLLATRQRPQKQQNADEKEDPKHHPARQPDRQPTAAARPRAGGSRVS